MALRGAVLTGYSGATAPDLHRTSLFGPGQWLGTTRTLQRYRFPVDDRTSCLQPPDLKTGD